MQPMAPRKTIVNVGGEHARKTVTAGRTAAPPLKTVVGSTARPPIKTVVGRTAAPPRKTIVGSTAAPPRKTTPANLGKGSNGPRPRNELAAPNSAANVRFANPASKGNTGTRVAAMPPKASGPPNPVLTWEKPQGISGILAGGMGQTRQNMRPPRSRRNAGGSVQSGFYGE